MKIKKSKTRVLISLSPLEFSKLDDIIQHYKSDIEEIMATDDEEDYQHMLAFTKRYDEANAAPVRALHESKKSAAARKKPVCNLVIPMAGKRRDTGLCDGWCNNCDVRVSGYATLSKAMKAVEEKHPTVPNKKKGKK